MAALENGLSAGEHDLSSPSPNSSTIKLPQMLRRGSTFDNIERTKDTTFRRVSFPVSEPDRKSSLPTLPLRLRRKKTQSVSEDTRQNAEAAEKLGRLFFSLPSEIITDIVTYLTIQDIYNLRLASHTFNTILNYNALGIARSILSQELPRPTYIHVQTHLYPPNQSSPDLSYLFATLRRNKILAKQTTNLLSFIQMKIYMTRTATRVLSVHDNRQRLTAALSRPAWFVHHFLEAYRSILIEQHPDHHENNNKNNASNKPAQPTTTGTCARCISSARDIVATYPAEDVMPAWHYYQLTLEHLQIATRAPMSTGSLERRLRRWTKSSVTEGYLAVFVVLGGLPEVKKVAMMQGDYGSRVRFMSGFVDTVREAVTANSAGDRTQLGSDDKSPGVSRRNSSATATAIAPVTATSHEGALMGSLAPPFSKLTQQHVDSLPDVTRFFYDIWAERIRECAPNGEETEGPYPWLQRIMEGSGLEFTTSRTPQTPLALGASPL